MSAIEEEDFSDYVEDTFDPGWAWTVGIAVACILINGSVPCLVRISKRWDDRKQKKKQELIINIPDQVDAPRSEPTIRFAEQGLPPQGAPATGTAAAKATAAADGGEAKSNSSVVSLSGGRSRSRHADNKDRLQASLSLSETQNNNATATSPKDDGSLLGTMDHDQVSANDAIDEESPSQSNIANTSSPHHQLSKPIIPLFGKKFVLEGLDKLIDIADWDKEMKRVWWLAKPFTIQAFLESLFAIVIVALVGHFLGVREANAYVVVTILSEFTNTINYGFHEALGTLGPQAEGAGNDQLVGQYMQLAMVFYALGAIPVIILWSLVTEEAVLWFGFDQETARIGQGYAYSYTVIELIRGVGYCLHSFLDFSDHEYYSTVVQVSDIVGQLVVVIVLPVSGCKDLVLIGIAQVAVTLFMTVGNFVYVTYRGWLDDVWEGLVKTNAFKNPRAIKNLFQQAIPLSISWILIYGEWELMTIFAVFMGPAEVAAWGILGFLWETFENITEGLAEAAEVRVAYHMGNGRPDRAKKCAYKSILLGFQIAVFSTGALYILAEYIPKWITPDPTLQKMIYEVLPLLGIGQIAMSLGIMCWSVIGAQGRYRLATTIEFIGSWFFVIPLCAVLVYGFHFNLQGMVGSTVLGYAISGAVNLFVVLRSDWKQLSDIVVARHEDEESSSSSSSSSSASAEDDESNAKSIASDAASSSADRPQPRTD